jgi:hypothetical protein
MKQLKFFLGILFFFMSYGVAYAEIQPFDFTLSQEIETDTGSFGLLPSDFNKDGNLDLIVGHNISHSSSVLFGNSTGLFSIMSQAFSIPGGVDFANGDFNEDGNIDVVSADELNRITISFWNNTDETFTESRQLTIASIQSLTGVTQGDFNRDGHLDIAAVGSTAKQVAILFGDGLGNFSEPIFLTAGLNTGDLSLGMFEVKAGDFNEDGNIDIAAYNGGESRAFVFLGDGNGEFLLFRSFEGVASGRDLTVVDINKDGHTDIISAGGVGTDIQVFLGDGIGNFSRTISTIGGTRAKNIAIADFDKDGNLDVIAPNQITGKIDIAVGDGNGGFTFVKSIFLGGTPRFAVAGDFNKDSFPDFAVTNPASGFDKTYIFLNNQNHAPILDPIGNKTVGEGEMLAFTLSATDADGNTLTYSASNLPVGATLDTATGVFSWTPSYNQSGNYADIEFSVTDNGTPMQLDSELISISVGDVNRPPVFVPVGSQEVLEDQPLAFSVSATDLDGDAVLFSATNLPAGATFDSGTVAFSWTPNNTQSGVYVVTFVALDNGSPAASSTLEVPITVGDVPTPVEQADNLVAAVINSTFPGNVENSYLANLRKVSIFIEGGKVGAAVNQLNAFINKVETDINSGVVTQTEGESLLVLANALLVDLQ